MNSLQVYLWLMLDSISGVFIAATILGAVASGVYVILFLCTSGDYYKEDHKNVLRFKWVLWLLLFCIPAVLIPTTKQMAVIMILPKIANSELAKEIPDDMKDMYDMTKDYLKKKLKGDE